MRLLICAGGTGGGVYPALSVLQAVSNQTEAILWVGSEGGMEADLVSRNGIEYQSIPAAGVHGVGLLAMPGNLLKLASGTLKSRRILKQFKPDVLLFTGGYVAVPMAVAGIRINSLLYVPDIEPGLALKALARYADVIALTADQSRRYFNPNKRMVTTGYPTRSRLSAWTRTKALKTLGLSSQKPVLLVIGGSKGARLINQAIFPNLPALLKIAQVVHITGQPDWEQAQQVAKNLDSSCASNYHPYPYLHDEIGAAFASSDLVISRAGASTLGELPLFGLPAILVPYPFAWRYQKVNADYLVSNGAAEMIENADLSEKIVETVKRLLSNKIQLSAMQENMKKLATPDASTGIADLLVELGHKQDSAKGIIHD